MSHFSRFLSTCRSAHPEFGPTGRQKSDNPPVFCLPSLEIQRGLRAKQRFFKSARKRSALGYGQNVDFWNFPVNACRTSRVLLNQEASRRWFLHRHCIFLEASCKSRSHIQMKISRTTKSDRVALKAHANYLNARPNELRCSKEAADYEFRIRTMD